MIHVPRRRATALLGTVLAGAAATTALVLPGGAHAAASRTTARACSASQIVETITADQGGGTAGAYYFTLHFTNLGATCTLHGYPGVSAVSTSGRQMGRAAARQSGSARTVTLRGASASSASSTSATLEFVNTSALRGCDQRLAAGIRVYAPNTSSSKVVPIVFDACSRGSDTFLRVKPIG